MLTILIALIPMNKREAGFFTRLRESPLVLYFVHFCVCCTLLLYPMVALEFQFLAHTSEKPRVKRLRGEVVLVLTQRQKRRGRVRQRWWKQGWQSHRKVVA